MFEIDPEDLKIDSDNLVAILTINRIPTRSNTIETQHIVLYTPEEDPKTLAAYCTCPRFCSDGFPCSHVTRVGTVYSELCQRWSDLPQVAGHRFRVENLWHPYWFRDQKTWTKEHILHLRAEMGSIGSQVAVEIEQLRRREGSASDPHPSEVQQLLDGKSLDEFLDDIVTQRKSDIQKYTSWAACRALIDQMQHVADGNGGEALRGLKLYLENGLALINTGEIPTTDDRKHPYPSMRAHRDVIQGSLPNRLEDPAVINNPNEGKSEQRCREKSHLEKGSRKKNKKATTANGESRDACRAENYNAEAPRALNGEIHETGPAQSHSAAVSRALARA
ncbi:hypothetical protein FGB62_141g028 [Gracilaria domingensis]|nr:hypothetical protein FGB62_141g028 [Gracilaria domingensis]